mmetsp:Transcript_126584/g.253092  ORF Transcript_126584/g.253092 Transcript_126584/m.253092 type:complete len:208 (-) Transcript_126584:124-747(-)|eukprot:CAMPEP_0172710152 /NCGR_PEP_ID=MMETSP1074-20121228/55489_1 /TAXON_ID=2916 /ORGANISM="Ceratium fusus, Strain PA161109" /LENGTH=207 /DNA_ID=CAMNT_0013533503 /DNA_START=40 /DNA_END=663 /DNA_ORIENTATION=+
MPWSDFWDVDEILAEQHEVTVRPLHDIVGAGILYPNATGAGQQDLTEGTKVQVPFWLAQGFVRRKTADLELPTMYGQSAQEDLQRDAAVCRLGDKSQYYFEVGIRLASLLKDTQLAEDLMDGLRVRWVEVCTQLGNLGVAKTQCSQLNPGSSIFHQTLTAVEQDMFCGGREAESHFRQWTDRFATYKMKASSIAEAPAATGKRARKK